MCVCVYVYIYMCVCIENRDKRRYKICWSCESAESSKIIYHTTGMPWETKVTCTFCFAGQYCSEAVGGSKCQGARSFLMLSLIAMLAQCSSSINLRVVWDLKSPKDRNHLQPCKIRHPKLCTKCTSQIPGFHCLLSLLPGFFNSHHLAGLLNASRWYMQHLSIYAIW